MSRTSASFTKYYLGIWGKTLSEAVGPSPCRGERTCVSLWSWERCLRGMKALAGLTKQISSTGRDQTKMGPTGLSRGKMAPPPLDSPCLSRGLNITQKKLKESWMVYWPGTPWALKEQVLRPKPWVWWWWWWWLSETTKESIPVKIGSIFPSIVKLN
jgi:hypothetical protein